MKKCPVCKYTKGLSNFCKDRKSKDGHFSRCRDCQKTIRKAYYVKNKDKERRTAREWQLNNKERDSENKREWHKRNIVRRRREENEWRKNKYHSDPAFKLTVQMRNRIVKALDGIGKSDSTMKLVACTPEFLKRHLESQFADGMAWGQKGKWHCDHRLPLAAFDLTDKRQQRYAFHWSNLQPLWAEVNLRKSDKYCPDELEAYLKSDLPEAI